MVLTGHTIARFVRFLPPFSWFPSRVISGMPGRGTCGTILAGPLACACPFVRGAEAACWSASVEPAAGGAIAALATSTGAAATAGTLAVGVVAWRSSGKFQSTGAQLWKLLLQPSLQASYLCPSALAVLLGVGVPPAGSGTFQLVGLCTSGPWQVVLVVAARLTLRRHLEYVNPVSWAHRSPPQGWGEEVPPVPEKPVHQAWPRDRWRGRRKPDHPNAAEQWPPRTMSPAH
eukprot:5826725-Amphidinium_carterae.1